MRATLNTLLNDWMVPILGFIIIGCIIYSLIKNFDTLTDGSGHGSRWAGLINVAKDAGYVALIPVVLVAVIKFISLIKLSL